MKKILIRAGMTPFDNWGASDIMLSNNIGPGHGNNLIGNNNGNMLYAFSVIRTLMKSSDYTICADNYLYESRIATDEEIDYVNSNYDLYVIPLANAFRYKFRFSLKRLTNFIRRIKIPVVVIGIGVGNLDEAYSNKDTIKAFVEAVLEKSAMIGVRGIITRDFLVDLGFKEDVDVTAIGCPSAYTFGPTVKVRQPKCGFFTKLVFNDNVRAGSKVNDFLYRTMAKNKNAWFLPQMIDELKELYIGASIKEADQDNSVYPVDLSHDYFKYGHSMYFLNIPTWLDFVSDAGLSIGSRMHGNVVPVLAGTPSLFIVIDSRMKDIVTYHHYPYVLRKEINSKTTLEELVARIDYSDFYKYQKENFDHYLDFLKANELSTIYDDGIIPARGETPFDKKLNEIQFKNGVTPITSCSKAEMIQRWGSYFPRENGYIKELKDEIKRLEKYKKNM